MSTEPELSDRFKDVSITPQAGSWDKINAAFQPSRKAVVIPVAVLSGFLFFLSTSIPVGDFYTGKGEDKLARFEKGTNELAGVNLQSQPNVSSANEKPAKAIVPEGTSSNDRVTSIQTKQKETRNKITPKNQAGIATNFKQNHRRRTANGVLAASTFITTTNTTNPLKEESSVSNLRTEGPALLNPMTTVLFVNYNLPSPVLTRQPETDFPPLTDTIAQKEDSIKKPERNWYLSLAGFGNERFIYDRNYPEGPIEIDNSGKFNLRRLVFELQVERVFYRFKKFDLLLRAAFGSFQQQYSGRQKTDVILGYEETAGANGERIATPTYATKTFSIQNRLYYGTLGVNALFPLQKSGRLSLRLGIDMIVLMNEKEGDFESKTSMPAYGILSAGIPYRILNKARFCVIAEPVIRYQPEPIQLGSVRESEIQTGLKVTVGF